MAGGRALMAAGVLVAPLWPQAGDATELTGYGVLTTDYVFRGVSYSDSDPAAQGGIDLSLDSGFYAGVWAAAIDIAVGPTRREVETNYYLGYDRELNADWSIGTNIVAYAFPGTEGPIDYGYHEFSLAANFRDRVWVEYSWSPDLFHTSSETHNLEVYGEWTLPHRLVFGVGAGYYDVGALTGVGYGYWQAGITRAFSRLSLDLRYHDTNRDVRFVSSPDRAQSRIVLSLRVPIAIAGH